VSAVTEVPTDLVRLLSLLGEHEGMQPDLDTDRPSIDVWVDEKGDGVLHRWVLVSIGERTCVVHNPRDRHDRVLRNHRHVWIRPGSVTDWRKTSPTGYRHQTRVTWTSQQGERGRQNALARRKEQGLEA